MPARVSVHRFRDEVALAVTGVGGETVYLEPADALAIAKHIRKAALSCKAEPFTLSNVGTISRPARRSGEPRKGE